MFGNWDPGCLQIPRGLYLFSFHSTCVKLQSVEVGATWECRSALFPPPLFQLLKKHYLTSSSNAMKEDDELEDDDDDYEELSEAEEVSNEQIRI